MAAADPVDTWEYERVVDYVQRHQYTRITLQFPDDLLQHAPSVAQELQQLLLNAGSTAKVYVLADTSYNPLSIDEVAAAHVKADCVVHYGYASLHPVSRTPALCVLPKQQLNVQIISTWLVQQLSELHAQVQSGCAPDTAQDSQQQQQQQLPVCVICSDQSYLHQLPDLQQAVLQAYSGPLQLVFAQSAATELWPQGHPAAAAGGGGAAGTASAVQSIQSAAAAADGDTPVPIGGLLWQLPSSSNSQPSSSSSSQPTCSGQPDLMVWLGPPSSSALTHLQLSFASCRWLLLDPETQGIAKGLSPGLDRVLKRRYYLVEKARGAAMVGLLVGTLGAAGYKTALEQLRRLASKAGKKTYTLLMGKPNPAKLANFPEIEVFVMLADPQGLVLDSKEYLHPIITPHEAFLAFTGKYFDPAHYRLDFGDLLQLEQQSTSGMQQQQGAGAGVDRASFCENITELDDEGDDVDEQLSAAAGALVIAGGSSQAITGNNAGQQVQVHSAAQFLTQRRTYKGLETPVTGAAVLPAAVALPGRSGRAAGYVDEPQK